MMLGDILAAAHRSGAGIETWLKPADPALWEFLSAEAGRQDLVPADIAQTAMAAFSDHASEEDWATLISKMRDAGDPGRVMLMTMIKWHLDTQQSDNAAAKREVAP